MAYACSRALRALLARDAPAEVCALADAVFEAPGRAARAPRDLSFRRVGRVEAGWFDATRAADVRVVLDDGTPRRFHLRWTTFLVLYGDLAKELRAFADVADAWLETLPNRPRRLQRDESGAEADEDIDDGGAA